MRIHVTKKLAEKLKKAGLVLTNSVGEQPSVLGDWHANITTIQRRQCIVFTHDTTRFSLALIGVTRKELKELPFWFSDMLGNTMLKLGYPAELVERAVSSVGEPGFDTRCDRSVQGTMRVTVQDLESYTWDGREITSFGPYSLSARLCERPCTIKGMKQSEFIWPTKAMRELLEQLLRIPRHRDRPFRLNVTACSGRT